MEWNQAKNEEEKWNNKLPIHLQGEIIQIGAVHLDENWQPAEEFQTDVKPVYFRKLHAKVIRLTGLNGARLSKACGFKTAFTNLREFCGDNCIFLTWGQDDQKIMEQNIIIHDLDWDWIAGWVDLQLMYDMQVVEDTTQRALHTAMEHYGIEPTRIAHDALGDAYHTAQVCSCMDLPAGLADYDNTRRRLNTSKAANAVYRAEEHLRFFGFPDHKTVFFDQDVTVSHCPDCGEPLTPKHWIGQSNHRYMGLVECPTHGAFMLRMRLRREEDETLTVNRSLYRADDAMIKFYRCKAAQQRHRKRKGHHR